MSTAEFGNAHHVDDIGIVRHRGREVSADQFLQHLRERWATGNYQHRPTRVLMQRLRGNRPSLGPLKYDRRAVQSLDERSSRLLRSTIVTLVDAIEPYGYPLAPAEHVGEVLGARFTLGRDRRVIDGTRCLLRRLHEKHDGRGRSGVESPAEREEHRSH